MQSDIPVYPAALYYMGEWAPGTATTEFHPLYLSFPLLFAGRQLSWGSQLHNQQKEPHSQMRTDSLPVEAMPKPHYPARIFFPVSRQIRKILTYTTHFSSMMVWPLLLVSSMMSFSSSGSKTCGTESLRAPTNKGCKRKEREELLVKTIYRC